jgi:hypothetical protein
MPVNESDLPQFAGKKLEPVGTFLGQQPKGPRQLTRKESGPMFKAIRALSKPSPSRPKSKARSVTKKRGVRSIEADQKVHLNHKHRHFYI